MATGNTPTSNAPAKNKDLTHPDFYFNRELSWLDFNARVLAMGTDRSLPLLEQVKFLAIFYNNLDEFFMVRVVSIYRRYRNGILSSAPDRIPPVRLLAAIRRRISELNKVAQEHWLKKLMPQLDRKGISITPYNRLSEKQRRFLFEYFKREIYPALTPQAIDTGHPFPTVSNISLNFIIQLEDKNGLSHFARLRCPRNVPRLIFVPRNREAKTYHALGLEANLRDGDIVLLEDLIKEHLNILFTGNTITNAGLFRITRNTDMEIEEDEADDLLEAVRDLVDQRRFGDVVRLEVSSGNSLAMPAFRARHLSLRPFQIYKTKGPLGFSDLISLCNADKPKLKYPSYFAAMPAFLKKNSIFDYLQNKDILLHHPYDSFTPVLDFIQSAAKDPAVIAIKQTLYRVGNDSPILKALMEARKQGKQVTAVVELKARFDEERNINWAEELEKAGVHVVYGLVGMKIHSKLCLIVRREGHHITSYAHIGTGNYNAASAAMYTDLSLMTAHPDICTDIADLFNVMTGYAQKEDYRTLMVSPLSLRKRLLDGIHREIAFCSRKEKGHLIFKCNQLVDRHIIAALYAASMAGVKIQLLIRGICCLRPGIPGISENIEVISIVGRFLEHSRIYWFNNGGDDCLYMGSADLMPRNLDRRIEVLVPVLDPALRKHIKQDILELQLRDNTQAWTLNTTGVYHRRKPEKGMRSIESQELMMLRKKQPLAP